MEINAGVVLAIPGLPPAIFLARRDTGAVLELDLQRTATVADMEWETTVLDAGKNCRDKVKRPMLLRLFGEGVIGQGSTLTVSMDGVREKVISLYGNPGRAYQGVLVEVGFTPDIQGRVINFRWHINGTGIVLRGMEAQFHKVS